MSSAPPERRVIFQPYPDKPHQKTANTLGSSPASATQDVSNRCTVAGFYGMVATVLKGFDVPTPTGDHPFK